MITSEQRPPERQSRSYGGWQQEKVAFIFGLSARRAAILAAAILGPDVQGRAGELAAYWPALRPDPDACPRGRAGALGDP